MILASFSNNDCNSYLTGCVVGNDNTSCMAKPTTCSSYTLSTNCAKGLASGADCYWNVSDGKCVDK